MYKESFSSSLLQEAVDQFSSLPGVGKKNALRLALHLLRLPVENVNALGNALINLRKGALYCKECNMEIGRAHV